MTTLPFAASAPVSVAKVGLRARDAVALATYYRSIVGLQELSRDGETIVLGAGNRPLLVIENDASLRPDDPRSAGLFHTAFLLPERSDLGRWINFAAKNNIAIEGASDHLVSEALYLTDPEGNGIEIYADRPRDQWKWDGEGIEMATLRMDIPSVRASVPDGDAGWNGAPENTIVGHVHLRVGDPSVAENWWNGEMGFDTVKRYGSSAVFLSTGGYHHHVGANAWQSAGAQLRESNRSGLSFVELRSNLTGQSSTHEDPWGNVVRVVADAA